VAFPFLEPVPLDVPGYHEEISSPLDLSTVQLRLQSGRYSDPSRMTVDLALIWANCRAFNRPDAPVVGAAAAAEAALAREWAAAGVWRAAPPPADWPAAAAGVLRALVESVPAAAWFAQPPAAADAPGYHDALARAGVPHVDLGAITTRLAEGGYAGPAALASDAAAAWAAAEAGHGAGHALASAAAATRDAFDRLWAAAGLPPAPAPAPEAGPGWEEAARRVLDGVSALPEAALFLRPVTEEDVEGYFDVIKAPMDLGTVRRRLLRKQYGAPAEALADARLVWRNCHVFNDVEDEVYAWGVRCEAAFEAAWTAAGLPGGGGSVMRDD
jgi:transcription initiation factor TFIID subunit 2